MLYSLKEYIENKEGSILPMAALLLPVIIGAAGIGVDVGMWAMNSRNLQSAADAAAIAGAWEIAYYNSENVEDAALKEALINGYNNEDSNSLDLTIGENEDGEATVTVTLSQQGQKYLSNVIFNKDIFTRVTATAGVLEVPSDFCMLSLHPDAPGALKISGTVDINSAGCGLAINSSDPDAALRIDGGSAEIEVGSVASVGGIKGEIEAADIQTGVRPFHDPYADLDIPSFNHCSHGDMNSGPVKAGDIPLPNAQGVSVLCGGLQIKNTDGTVELDPGIYILDGGDLDVRNGGILTGDGVSIILTNSGGSSYGSYGNLDIKGELDISAPAPDSLSSTWKDYEGVAIYQDRTAPEGSTCNTIAGTGMMSVDGTTYTPARCLDLGGTPSLDAGNNCSRTIARTIRMHGDPNIANSCEGSAAKDIPEPTRVRLLL